MAFVEGHHGRGQPDQEERAGIANAAMYPVFELTPVSRGLSELVRNELVGESFTEGEWSFVPLNALVDGDALLRGGLVTPIP